MPDPTLLDVVSAAIDGQEPPAPTPESDNASNPDATATSGAPDGTAGNATGSDTTAGSSAAGEENAPDGAAAAGDGEAAGEDADDGVAVGADGRPRDASGRFASKKPEDKTSDGKDPAAAAAKKPDEGKPAPAAPAGEQKKPDPINDPLPQGLKQATQERMQSLISIAKEKTTQAEQLTGDMQAVMAPIQASGMDAEQFTETMELMRLVNSRDPAENTRAFQMLQAAADQIADRLGIPRTGVDPLTGFDDLIEQVRTGKSTREVAEQAAQHRRAVAAAAQRTTQQQQVQQQTEAQRQAMLDGQDAIRAVEASLKVNDPAFPLKVGLLQKDTAFVAQLRAAPPHRWAAMYAAKYAELKLPTPAPASAPAGGSAPGARPTGTPMRGKTPAGGSAATPKSALEAMNAALGS